MAAMCQLLSEMKVAFQVFATRFDPSLISCAEATAIVQDVAEIEHMAAAVKALAAARAAEDRRWKVDGYRSAEDALARRTGTSVAGAREALRLGRRLKEQPEVAEAARRGELSPTQASAISDAVAADPTAAASLVDSVSRGGSVADLKNRCAEIKAASTDLETRRAAIHRNRYLRSWTDTDGQWRLVAGANPENGAQIMAALAPIAERMFRAARTGGSHEHPDAYRFDALLELALNATSNPDCKALDTSVQAPASDTDDRSEHDRSHPEQHYHFPNRPGSTESHAEFDPRTSAQGDGFCGSDQPSGRNRPSPRVRCGAPVKLLVRVDLSTLMRGFPIDGETCELVGFGPIAVSAVNDLVSGGDPFVAAILTKGKQLVGVAHLGRQPTSHQRSALEWLYPTCAAEGCPTPAQHLEVDHRIDWSQTHITLLDWLDGLCPHDHAKKTRYGWSLVPGIGKRPFVAPTDPRHPGYKRLRKE
jgi:hypothetical protein